MAGLRKRDGDHEKDLAVRECRERASKAITQRKHCCGIAASPRIPSPYGLVPGPWHQPGGLGGDLLQSPPFALTAM
jgi:hypothetical protein